MNRPWESMGATRRMTTVVGVQGGEEEEEEGEDVTGVYFIIPVQY